MAEFWFYSHNDGPRSGPFSDRQLRDLADADQIQRTDTIWKQGTARGVLAGKVKNLFAAVQACVASPAIPVVVAVAVAASSPPGVAVGNTVCESPYLPSSQALPALDPAAGTPVPTDPGQAPQGAATVTEAPDAADAVPARPRPVPQQRRARATAGRGAEIVGQDGTNVKFRKRCLVCGYHDTCWNSMRIVNGVTRVPFYCPKCRKSRGTEIHGSFN